MRIRKEVKHTTSLGNIYEWRIKHNWIWYPRCGKNRQVCFYGKVQWKMVAERVLLRSSAVVVVNPSRLWKWAVLSVPGEYYCSVVKMLRLLAVQKSGNNEASTWSRGRKRVLMHTPDWLKWWSLGDVVTGITPIRIMLIARQSWEPDTLWTFQSHARTSIQDLSRHEDSRLCRRSRVRFP